MRGCPRFGSGSPAADAVRFTVTADEGGLVRIAFVHERNHLPHDHGSFECSAEEDRFRAGPEEGLLRRQALAYLRSYLRRKTQQ